MAEGRIPDLAAWRRVFREILGQAFTIRGVEASIEGRLAEWAGRLELTVEGSEEILGLASLTEKVQWDPRRRRPQKATREERGALARLSAEGKGRPGRIRITGPLREVEGGGPPLVEVREFAWVR